MKISIITVVHNNKKHIEGCIDSVINQTYKDLEYIIVDGGSTDGTVDIIQNSKVKIQNCVFLSEKDNGIYDAINKGIKNSNGDVIGLLHSDDVFADNNVVEQVVSKFDNTKTDSVYGDLEYVSANDTNRRLRYWRAGDCDIKKLKHGWMPPHPAFFVKREVFSKFGLYSTEYKVAADYEMVLRLLWKERITTEYLPIVITKMRWGGASNRDIASVMLKSREDYEALKANSVPNPLIAVFMKNVRKLNQFIGH
jgi:glycosyltransferase